MRRRSRSRSRLRDRSDEAKRGGRSGSRTQQVAGSTIASSQAFKPGDRIVLHGLVRNATLNGNFGVIMPNDGNLLAPGAVKVRLDLGPEVALKPDNIRLVTEVRAEAEAPAAVTATTAPEGTAPPAAFSSSGGSAVPKFFPPSQPPPPPPPPAPVASSANIAMSETIQRAKAIAAQIAAQHADEMSGAVSSDATGGDEPADPAAETPVGEAPVMETVAAEQAAEEKHAAVGQLAATEALAEVPTAENASIESETEEAAEASARTAAEAVASAKVGEESVAKPLGDAPPSVPVAAEAEGRAGGDASRGGDQEDKVA